MTINTVYNTKAFAGDISAFKSLCGSDPERLVFCAYIAILIGLDVKNLGDVLKVSEPEVEKTIIKLKELGYIEGDTFKQFKDD